MQVLSLTPSEKLTLEQELLKTFGNAVLKNTQGDPIGKSNMTMLSLTTVSAGRASLTFIYNHDDTRITNPGVWQVSIAELRTYFDDRVIAILDRHGVINN